MITLSCDIDAAKKQVQSLQESQLPFIIAKSLTSVAQEAQKAVRIVEGQVFTTRNDWTVRRTLITPATRQTLTAQVYTDTGNRKSGAPDYLANQEDGGERVPVGGRKYLTLPTDYLWKYTPKNRPIPDNLRPRTLLGPTRVNIGDAVSGTFVGGKVAGVKRAIGRETLKKLGRSDYVAFLQYAKTGTLCIFVRHGGFGWHGGKQDAEPWYVLISKAIIKPRLHMQQTVEGVVTRQFEEIFVTVAREAGVSVKL